jgi:hypothetical protein
MRKRLPKETYCIPKDAFDRFAGKKVRVRDTFERPTYTNKPETGWLVLIEEDQVGYFWPDTFFRRRK